MSSTVSTTLQTTHKDTTADSTKDMEVLLWKMIEKLGFKGTLIVLLLALTLVSLAVFI